MTTVAYAAVTRSGLSFDRQLWMRPEIIPGLRRLTDAVHAEGAAAGIQLGHCGNMSHKSICGCTPVGASGGFNLYSPTFVRGLRADELPELARAYGRSVNLAREAGFDAVEIHAGHGYLISQRFRPKEMLPTGLRNVSTATTGCGRSNGGWTSRRRPPGMWSCVRPTVSAARSANAFGSIRGCAATCFWNTAPTVTGWRSTARPAKCRWSIRLKSGSRKVCNYL